MQRNPAHTRIALIAKKVQRWNLHRNNGWRGNVASLKQPMRDLDLYYDKTLLILFSSWFLFSDIPYILLLALYLYL